MQAYGDAQIADLGECRDVDLPDRLRNDVVLPQHPRRRWIEFGLLEQVHVIADHHGRLVEPLPQRHRLEVLHELRGLESDDRLSRRRIGPADRERSGDQTEGGTMC